MTGHLEVTAAYVTKAANMVLPLTLVAYDDSAVIKAIL